MEAVIPMYSSQADLWKSLSLLCAHTAPLLLLKILNYQSDGLYAACFMSGEQKKYF
jgi:hypothetical protein